MHFNVNINIYGTHHIRILYLLQYLFCKFEMMRKLILPSFNVVILFSEVWHVVKYMMLDPECVVSLHCSMSGTLSQLEDDFIFLQENFTCSKVNTVYGLC